MGTELALLAAQTAKEKKDEASNLISRAESRASARTGNKTINVDIGAFFKTKNLITLGVVFVILVAGYLLFKKFGRG